VKNIPIPNQDQYLKEIIDKLEHFIKRLHWKAIFFVKEAENDSAEALENYGFKLKKVRPNTKTS